MNAILAKYKEDEGSGKHWLPDEEVNDTIYDNNANGSPLRRLVVDTYLWSNLPVDDIDLIDCQEDFRRDFVSEVVRRTSKPWPKLMEVLSAGFRGEDLFDYCRQMLEGIPSLPGGTTIPASRSCCDYHLHTRDALCGNRKRRETQRRKLRHEVPGRTLDCLLRVSYRPTGIVKCCYFDDGA